MPETLPELGQVDWGAALNAILSDLDDRTSTVEAAAADLATRVDDLDTATAGVPGLQADVDDIESAWTAFTPVVKAGGVAYTFAAGVARGAYKLVGKTLHLNIDVTNNPTGGGAAGGITVDLPAGLTSVGRNQIVPCIYNMSSPIAGYPASQWQNQFLTPNATALTLIKVSSDGSGTGNPSNAEGLHELHISAVIEVQ